MCLRQLEAVEAVHTVVTDEIKFGDNDTLGALVANLVDADALVILTEWDQFRALDLTRIAATMTRPLLIDLRNVYRAHEVAADGMEYVGIGKP
jgi:glutamate 5-kinase